MDDEEFIVFDPDLELEWELEDDLPTPIERARARLAQRRFLLDETEDLLDRFLGELRKPTLDGSGKRRQGEKPPWYIDPDHHRGMFSHYRRWLAGELVDPDSGSHPLVHMAWRCLALACVETGNVPYRGDDDGDRGADAA